MANKLSFDQAFEEARRMADGVASSVTYTRMDIPDIPGPPYEDYNVYIHGYGTTRGKSWGEAFCAMHKRMAEPRPIVSEVVA